MEPELVEDAFVPQISMGINTGDVISGNIGSATLRRLDYTVIGDVVNTAQRLQVAASPGQILISESCYNKVKDSFYCKEVGMKNFRHKTNPALVYEVMS
jgi:class 3 adenylate cyclase